MSSLIPRFAVRSLVTGLLSLALVACATTQNEAKLLDESFVAHASLVRWGDPLGSLEFVDPELRGTFELTSLERERWRQFRVAGYRAQPVVMLAPDRAQRAVELELVNRNTQAARSVAWQQEWRFDAEAERWWLVSGLPSLDAGLR